MWLCYAARRMTKQTNNAAPESHNATDATTNNGKVMRFQPTVVNVDKLGFKKIEIKN
jgi:hypothetical protein